MNNRILRLPHVISKTGQSRSTIYERVADGSFPKPIKLGCRSVGWLEHEVEVWIADCIANSRNSDDASR